MSATLTLDLFRPSILDPVEPAGAQLRVTRPGAGRERAPERTPVGAPVDGDQRVRVPASGPQGGETLDDLVVGVWEDLTAHRTVACLACGEAMTPRYGAGHAPVGGRCKACGTTIQ